jgi:hypothetical protein
MPDRTGPFGDDGVLQAEAVAGAAVLDPPGEPPRRAQLLLRLDRELALADPDMHTVTLRVAVRSNARAMP